MKVLGTDGVQDFISLKLANFPLTAPSVLLQNIWHRRSDFKPQQQWWYIHQLLPLSFTKGAISFPKLSPTTSGNVPEAGGGRSLQPLCPA